MSFDRGNEGPIAHARSCLRTRIALLEESDIATLRDAWQAAWGTIAPKGARGRFLMLGIAWKWQAEAYGGFSPELSRRLSALETCGSTGHSNSDVGICDVKLAARPVPGTRLIREWKGERYEVHVTEQGYLWRGKTYGSLSRVAKMITGVNQNGPQFFGLRNSAKPCR